MGTVCCKDRTHQAGLASQDGYLCCELLLGLAIIEVTFGFKTGSLIVDLPHHGTVGKWIFFFKKFYNR